MVEFETYPCDEALPSEAETEQMRIDNLPDVDLQDCGWCDGTGDGNEIRRRCEEGPFSYRPCEHCQGWQRQYAGSIR